MFGSLYSKAVELFGKAFLISAFIPVAVVSALLAISIDPQRSIAGITGWTAEKFTVQSGRAILLLIALYLFAFVLYGLRDQITEFIAGGYFWLINELRVKRRQRFVAAMREAALQKRSSLALPNATAWAESGFGCPEAEDVYLPPGTTKGTLEKEIESGLKRVGMEINCGILTADVEYRSVDLLSGLFTNMHRFALIGDETKARAFQKRLRDLCTEARIDIKAWTSALQVMTYGELSDIFAGQLWSPPPRYAQPTALGNVLVWSAVYTRERYGIELHFLYPRLLKVIETPYEAKIADKQQFLDFAVVLTFLSFVGAIVFGVARLNDLAAAVVEQWAELGPYSGWSGFPVAARKVLMNWPSAIPPLLIIVAWIALGILAYRVAIAAAHNALLMVTSAADLYRLKVLESLGFDKPKSADDEREIWATLNESIESGQPPPEPPAAPPTTLPLPAAIAPSRTKFAVIAAAIACAAVLLHRTLRTR